MPEGGGLFEFLGQAVKNPKEIPFDQFSSQIYSCMIQLWSDRWGHKNIEQLNGPCQLPEMDLN